MCSLFDLFGAMISSPGLVTRGNIANGPCPDCGYATLHVEKEEGALLSYVEPSDIRCTACGWSADKGEDAYCSSCGWVGLKREGWDDGRGNWCPECKQPASVVGEKMKSS